MLRKAPVPDYVFNNEQQAKSNEQRVKGNMQRTTSIK